MKLTLPRPNIKIKFSFPLKRKQRLGVGIQITKSFFRLLALKEDKSLAFEPLELFWHDKEEGEKVNILKKALEERGLLGSELFTCLSIDEGLIKFHTFPSALKGEDLKRSIDFNIRSDVAEIGGKNIVYDYQLLEEGEQRKLLVVLAKEEDVVGLKRFVEEAGAKLKAISYEVITVLNFCLSQNLPKPFNVLYVDYHTSFALTYSEDLRYLKLSLEIGKFVRGEMDSMELTSLVGETNTQLMLNDFRNLYLVGPILEFVEVRDMAMQTFEIFGVLSLEKIPSNFVIPYTLALESLEWED